MRFLAFIVFLVGCHPQQGTRAYWPATVWKWDGYSEGEVQEVTAAFEDLNSLDTWVSLAPLEQKSYPIFLEILTDPPKEATLGTATRNFSNCVIAIRKDVFANARLNVYLPVIIWHEVGHCAGLEHEEKGGYVMSKQVFPLYRFPQKRVDYFLEKLRKATEL